MVSTFTVPTTIDAPRVAVIVTVTGTVAGDAVIIKAKVFDPAEILTVTGIDTVDELLASESTVPPVGAGPERAPVQTFEVPLSSTFGQLMLLMVSACAATATCTVLETSATLAVTLDTPLPEAAAVAINCVEEAPWLIRTDAGT